MCVIKVLQSERVPTILKALEKQNFTIRLHIKEGNVLGKLNSYCASGVSVCQSAVPNSTEETPTPSSAIPNTLTQVIEINNIMVFKFNRTDFNVAVITFCRTRDQAII